MYFSLDYMLRNFYTFDSCFTHVDATLDEVHRMGAQANATKGKATNKGNTVRDRIEAVPEVFLASVHAAFGDALSMSVKPRDILEAP